VKLRVKWCLFSEAASLWLSHNPSRLGASLAYYAVLSLAPLLVLTVAICGFVFGETAVRGEVYWQVKGVIGSQAAEIVQTLLKAAHRPGSGIFATIVGFIVLLFGASGVFSELRDILNFIWNAPPSGPTTLMGLIRYRFFSFAMVCSVGFLLIISLAVSAVIQTLAAYASRFVTFPAAILETINGVTGFLVISFLFALIYRVIPEVPIDWRDVGLGAVLTAGLFTAGKFALAFYLARAGVGSPYGAAGSLIVLLVWVYYSSQIFLYGAEFTYVCARHRGSAAIRNATMSREGQPPRLRAGLREQAT
jgi:membrane protein